MNKKSPMHLVCAWDVIYAVPPCLPSAQPGSFDRIRLMKASHLMVTESPDRIGATQS
ncbi:MAG: hypothetical protein HDR22_05740 [Lachnospiraceae bacterium]|nr:hypothetical protein [Lachnospiraceae bacterium]